MMNYIRTYLICLVSLIGLDYLRLGVVIQSQIQKRLSPLLRDPILLSPALGFYALYIIPLMIFAIMPAVSKGSRLLAAGYGALLGATAYMTYDLTNRSTLKSRPVGMILPDILRGTFVSSLVAVIGYFVWMKISTL